MIYLIIKAMISLLVYIYFHTTVASFLYEAIKSDIQNIKYLNMIITTPFIELKTEYVDVTILCIELIIWYAKYTDKLGCIYLADQ